MNTTDVKELTLGAKQAIGNLLVNYIESKKTFTLEDCIKYSTSIAAKQLTLFNLSAEDIEKTTCAWFSLFAQKHLIIRLGNSSLYRKITPDEMTAAYNRFAQTEAAKDGETNGKI